MIYPDFSVAGKTILITGGIGGIGGAFTAGFLAQGASVINADLTPPDNRNDPGVRYEALDVRDDQSVQRLADSIPSVDAIIHCAGRIAPFEEHQPEIFKDILDIHLVGNLRLANAFRPHLKKTGGCLVNIASMYSFFGSPYVPAYSAAKTAVISLTKSLAISLAADGIRANAIAPGWIKSEISRGGSENPGFNARVLARIPDGKWARPEDLVGTAVFLVSSASKLINGVTIPVDGGYCAS